MDISRMSSVRFRPDYFRCRLNPVSENFSIGRKPSTLRLCSAAADPIQFTIEIENNNNIKNNDNNRMFILGIGYVGEFFAQDLINQGWVVSGTCTSVDKKDRLKKLGLNVHLFDANHPQTEVLNILNRHTHLLVSIPTYKDIGDPMLPHVELLKKNLSNEHLQWLCYLSTTSVYGDCGGAWVDEKYQPNPSNELSKLRLAAEEGWLSLGHDLGVATHVFRLGGIYGPRRSAIDTIIKKGPTSDLQRVRSFKKYTSRIHVADICNALKSCIHKPSPGKIYNIVDDDPAPRTEVFSFASTLINEKWPSRMKEAASPATNESVTYERSSRGDKRVVNERMKKELGVSLIHPSYRSGLQSICDQLDDSLPSSSC
ncbi:uncharacterized protein [Rutidosis leptorrhynchoides]|uniref:uncharacterized protein n=1 Tax=Rutidosis leptorrhynchoides TaxID=125765 RepID=UPI003A9983E6